MKAPPEDSRTGPARRPQVQRIPTSARVGRQPAAARQREAQAAAVVVEAVAAPGPRPAGRRPMSERAAVQRAQPARAAARPPAARAERRPNSERAVHQPVRRVRRHPTLVPRLPEAAPAEREARRATPRSPAGQAWPRTTRADPSSVMRRVARSRWARLEPAPAWTAAPTSRLRRPDAAASQSTAGSGTKGGPADFLSFV